MVIAAREVDDPCAYAQSHGIMEWLAAGAGG